MADLDRRIGFLQWVLGEEDGFVAVGYRSFRTGAFVEQFFAWTAAMDELKEFIDQRITSGNLYFCPTVLRTTKRVKENISTSSVAWADLDTCEPHNLRVPPSVVIETSPKRYQAYWKFSQTQDAAAVEKLNKKIAYAHLDEGCDKSGWDLTQLLRIPETNNFKYLPAIHKINAGDVLVGKLYTPEDFAAYEDVKVYTESSEGEPFPGNDVLGQYDPELALSKAKTNLSGRAWTLLEEAPGEGGSWSENLWALMVALINAGLDLEEAFAVAWQAPCNKWQRTYGDTNQARELLWKDLVRAKQASEKYISHSIEDETEGAFYVPHVPLLTEAERKVAQQRKTIVEEYIEWARTIGDAAVQYHEAGAFIILSALLCGSVRLPTSYGSVVPNLWFMILADTTLTRKTTAMDLAMDLIVEIDPDIILATDGSIEGLMTSLSIRPGRPSVFLRDEFSGLLEQVAKRDYYAGMLETFTKLYDGKLQKRVLRKEIISVKDPRLIVFAGGIRDRIYGLLTQEHINSGFAPRFCFITAESDPTRLKPLGPPTLESMSERDYLLQRFQDIYNHYNAPVKDEHAPEDDQVIDFRHAVHNVRLTPEAWVRYNKIEAIMIDIGLKSSADHMLTPMLARLTQSGLKVAMLLAAARRLAVDEVVVDKHDIVQAFFYVERWKQHALNVVANVGKTGTEKELDRVYNFVCDNPGVQRSRIMQTHFLTARTADAVFATLQQRNMIRVERAKGKKEVYYPVRTNRPVKVEK